MTLYTEVIYKICFREIRYKTISMCDEKSYIINVPNKQLKKYYIKKTGITGYNTVQRNFFQI